jgi:prophage antirepressor-like protein
MNKVKQFLSDVFGEVRAFEEDGVIWFVAQDIAQILEYSNTQKVTDKVDKEDYRTWVTLTNGGNQSMVVINESGLYQTVMSITKKNKERYEKAREFKRWICGTVIPALRKDGAYVQDEEKVTSGEMSEDEFVLKAMTILQSKVERLTKERDEYKGEVRQFLDTENLLSWDTVAKNLNIGRNTMLRKLREMKILQSDTYEYLGKTYYGDSHNVPYQSFMKYFDVKYKIKNNRRYPVVLVNSLGQEYLYKKLLKKEVA